MANANRDDANRGLVEMRDLDNDAFLQQVLNELNELEDFSIYTPEDVENNLQKVDYVDDGATVEGRRFFPLDFHQRPRRIPPPRQFL